MHLCVYASMHLCIYVSMHLCVSASMYLCIYVSLHLYSTLHYITLHTQLVCITCTWHRTEAWRPQLSFCNGQLNVTFPPTFARHVKDHWLYQEIEQLGKTSQGNHEKPHN